MDRSRGRRERRLLLPLAPLALVLVSACGLFQSEPEPTTPVPREVPADTVRAPAPSDTVRIPAPTDTMPPARDTAARPTPPPDTAAPPRPEPDVRDPDRRPAMRRPPPAALPGSVLPRERIVAFYGHAGSKNMGILGELPPDQMLARLDREVAAWEAADPSTPVRPALHVIATMATGDPGPDGKYRLRMPSALIERVLSWAERRDALVILDIQPGRSTVAEELPRLARWLELPNVHLALDPEWDMGPDQVPGRAIGSMRAADVNVAVEFLADLVEEKGLPPKVLVVHRFTDHMLPNPEDIDLDPRVQLVVNMDGWGPPSQKLNTYRAIVAPEVPQYAGFKLFYKNDVRGGSRMLTPGELLALLPVPIYIQYQ